ncbi:cation transport ATPase (P-type) domain-containing protein [Trichoderma breve]|uniref:Phospholipid-transporting ATPase n=1 Tax=Trichoderma breve TaxID=2034170 RepID=A0A9W9EC47_9HYPO|nr:cation transport ATPase (P-type) domain-containing protein [Trichoderma breve]KAJ4864011.1 cation transport ATPase (P-type) domain-containing protein [Trichoderma breve]
MPLPRHQPLLPDEPSHADDAEQEALVQEIVQDATVSGDLLTSESNEPRVAGPRRSQTDPIELSIQSQTSRRVSAEPTTKPHFSEHFHSSRGPSEGKMAHETSPRDGLLSTEVTSIKPSPSSGIKEFGRKKATKAKQRHWMLSSEWKDHAAAGIQKFFWETILRRKPLLPSKDGRHIPLNPTSVDPGGLIDERSNKPYISNFIRSSRYTVYDFVPKQLVFQFSKLGNFYLLIMGILQVIPGLSTVGRYTTIAPLIGFVAFSMAKEGYDDYRRYQLDKSENRSMTWVLTLDETNDWMNIQWQHVQVGDVVRLRRDESVPADIVMLHATGPNGVAYIETMALDGETNLKAKQACPLLAERCGTVEGLRSTQATVVSEDPNLDLYNFVGRVTVNGGETVPLSMNNVIYRGSILRNTAMAIGLVVNSGEECKIRMNANKNVHAKKPAMQSTINKMVLFQITIVLSLAIGFTIGYNIWENGTEDKSFYLVQSGVYDASVPFKQIFFGFLIMFNTLIPLSLYISLEIVKIGQLFLLQDVDMYDPVTDTPMVANTTTILENLGQVSYVFSDKTGTLTENLMRFRKLSVAGVVCLHDMDIQGESTRAKGKQPMSANAPVDMKTEELLDYIRRRPNTPFSQKAKQFLLCIALCHTCLPETNESGEIEYQAASPDELALVEAARDLGYILIDRPAQSIKLQMQGADGALQTETYQVLDVIEFSSKRKRMSIIVRMPDNRICVFCKGADNVIMARLRLNQVAAQKAKDVNRRASVRKTFEQDKAIKRMSSQISRKNSTRNSFGVARSKSTAGLEGLRSNIARRSTDLNRLSQAEEMASWLHRRNTEEIVTPRPSTDVLRSPRQSLGRMPSWDYRDYAGDDDERIDELVAADEATIFEKCFQHVDDFAVEGLRTLLYAYRHIDEDTYAQWKASYREAETSLVDRQERIEIAGEKIEEGFELAGATAIEDKLQEGVPETIDKLRRANIKVWMLTGDKRETAINIGHSARVCKPFSEIYILDSSKGKLQEALMTTLTEVARGMVPHSVVVVDGQTLAVIDADDELAALFYDLVVRIDSVICCRASPSQKANLVKSIRKFVPKSMTLAIGDGANDIGMIQASHVGIGISGREGLQAARIADYSIAQFRFLQKLLFVHGRWNYIRTGKYVLATFWKETFFFLIQAQFQRFNGYTGTSLYESWSLTLFNGAFTSLPVILLGIFDRDLQPATLLSVPELYTFGQQRKGFNVLQYLGWMVMAVADSVVTFYFMLEAFQSILFTEDNGLYAMGTICFSVGVIFINTKLLLLEFHSKTLIPLIGLAIEITGWFLWNLILSAIYQRTVGPIIVRDEFIHNFGPRLSWWTSLVLGLVTPIIMELAVQAVRRVYFPTDQDLMQRIEKDANSKEILKKYAMDGGADVEAGNTQGIELEEMRLPSDQREEGVTLLADHDRSQSPQPVSAVSRRSFHELGQRRSLRVSHDDYRPPGFTPLVEEGENALEEVDTRRERG